MHGTLVAELKPGTANELEARRQYLFPMQAEEKGRSARFLDIRASTAYTNALAACEIA
jgi:hypothetical protein